jgi:hypothetical protein
MMEKIEEWEKKNLEIFWLPTYSPKLYGSPLNCVENGGSSPSCVEKCIIYYTEAGGAVCG